MIPEVSRTVYASIIIEVEISLQIYFMCSYYFISCYILINL